MATPPAFTPEASATDACSRLADLGWRQVGAGDWSWVFADPGDSQAARVTPFDPGYRMFADACLAEPDNRWLPSVSGVLPLTRDGYVVLMERLWPADEAAASAFCAALGIPNETHAKPPTAGPQVSADEPELVVLRSRIRDLLAAGKGRYGRWAVSDIREGNVMADRAGNLKLVDPLGVGGWMIAEALRAGHTDDLLADFSRTQLTDFLSIPYFGPGREGLDERDELLGLVDRLESPPTAG
jgi:hypothetical protein